MEQRDLTVSAPTMTEGQRAGLGRHTEYSIGERRFSDAKCSVFELFWLDKRMLAVNVRATELELFFFQPGAWECAFGSDSGGDTLVCDRWIFAKTGDPIWEAFVASQDYQRPPLRITGDPDMVEPTRKRQKRLY